jgi:putative Ca2+/H+ antiporter (TMEM165/GDT1 family)
MLTLWPIFVTVLFAELGDKTQLSTLLFAADQQVSKIGVFAASSAALVLSSLLAVLLGAQLSLCFATGTETHSRGGVCHHRPLDVAGCTVELASEEATITTHWKN